MTGRPSCTGRFHEARSTRRLSIPRFSVAVRVWVNKRVRRGHICTPIDLLGKRGKGVAFQGTCLYAEPLKTAGLAERARNDGRCVHSVR